MKIGFHTRITNPLTLGYYAYLACIDSWRKFADEVVVVDGGSTDGSLELLQDWTDHDPGVRILSNSMSFWGPNFKWEQSPLNCQLGQEELESCDWIIRADADHVLDTRMAQGLRSELENNCSQFLNVAFPVLYFWNGRYHYRPVPRNWIINNRVAKSRDIRIGWGQDTNTGSLSDLPLQISQETTFFDPDTRMKKPLLMGIPIKPEHTCAANVYRYGHFFFTKKQAIAKCLIWDRAAVGYLDKRPKSRLAIRLDAEVVGIRRYLSRFDVLDMDHPPEANRLMEKYYQPGSLGGALYIPGVKSIFKILRYFVRIQNGLHKIADRMARRVHKK